MDKNSGITKYKLRKIIHAKIMKTLTSTGRKNFMYPSIVKIEENTIFG